MLGPELGFYGRVASALKNLAVFLAAVVVGGVFSPLILPPVRGSHCVALGWPGTHL